MTCGKPCSIYSRVTGYYRPVENWNKGKQEEFRERKQYNVKESLNKKCEKQEAVK